MFHLGWSTLKTIDIFSRGFKRKQHKMLKGFDSGTSKKRQRNGRVFNLEEERQRGHVTVYRR